MAKKNKKSRAEILLKRREVNKEQAILCKENVAAIAHRSGQPEQDIRLLLMMQDQTTDIKDRVVKYVVKNDSWPEGCEGMVTEIVTDEETATELQVEEE